VGVVEMLRDMTNLHCGRWTVIRQAENDKNDNARWLCRCDCGTERIVLGQNLIGRQKSSNSRSCGCLMKEELKTKFINTDAHNWRGGRRVQKDGYYVVLTNAIYPGSKLRNQTLEHIVVMSNHLGRHLSFGEKVHHKNGIRSDNRIENLELWSSSHPSGQRVEDLISWAKEILRKYESSPTQNEQKGPNIIYLGATG
jgi:hypothetical protein